MILKRLIAKGGDSIAFRKGKLFLNGKEVKEEYVLLPCSWDLPERKVPEDSYYLIGDNRSMNMEEHVFGAIKKRYLLGTPLWSKSFLHLKTEKRKDKGCPAGSPSGKKRKRIRSNRSCLRWKRHGVFWKWPKTLPNQAPHRKAQGAP
ncbi:MAG: signal peptidase I, partial [Lentisphaeria bacterium]|nr:signal peptidase I [Lentisphaeria bacterium]